MYGHKTEHIMFIRENNVSTRVMKIVDDAEGLSEGEWVLLFNDKVIDHSANVEDMLKLAQDKYPNEKYPKDSIKISKIFSKITPRETLLDK